jgi:hypothetical protein
MGTMAENFRTSKLERFIGVMEQLNLKNKLEIAEQKLNDSGNELISFKEGQVAGFEVMMELLKKEFDIPNA